MAAGEVGRQLWAQALDRGSLSVAGFDGEQWRNGGNTTAQSMVLEHGIGASFTTVSTWTAPGGNFDRASPIATSTPAAVDGNVAGKVTGKGCYFWFDLDNRLHTLDWWIENNDAGNDHGLAIDDFILNNILTNTSCLISTADFLNVGT